MDDLFNYDNKFFRFMNKVADGFHVSVLWILFCIPIVTAGASTTALYYTVHKSLRRNRGYVWKNFWDSFKSNFKQTTKIWLIMLALFALLYADRQISYQFVIADTSMAFLYYIFYFLIPVWLVWCVYIFVYSARFENGIKKTMKNAAMIALMNLPWSLLALVLVVAGILVVYLSPVTAVFIPAAVTCLLELFMEKNLRKYMSQEDLDREEELDQERIDY